MSEAARGLVAAPSAAGSPAGSDGLAGALFRGLLVPGSEAPDNGIGIELLDADTVSGGAGSLLDSAAGGMDFFGAFGSLGGLAAADRPSASFIPAPFSLTLHAGDDGLSGAGYALVATVQAGTGASAEDGRISAFEGASALA